MRFNQVNHNKRVVGCPGGQRLLALVRLSALRSRTLQRGVRSSFHGRFSGMF